MHWNHRVMAKQNGKHVLFGIHEVFYAEDGTPESCTVDAMAPFGKTAEELKKDIERMLEATNHPILGHSEKFPQEYQEE